MFGLTPYNRTNIEKRTRDIFDMASQLESFFNDSIFSSFYGMSNTMKVDIKENEKEYTVHADLPGVSKEQINVDLHNDVLTISVVREDQLHEEKENYVRRERRYGSMTRSFAVENAKEDGVKAKFENGVLSLVISKNEPGTVKKSKIMIE